MKKEIIVVRKKNNFSSKIFSGFLTGVVILMLLFSGPAQALNLNLEISEKEIIKGEKTNFFVRVDMESENLSIDYLSLNLIGPIETECKFKTNGEIIENCDGIIIEKIKTNKYGYGYEEDKKILNYKITLDSNEYFAGVYEIFLYVYTKDKVYMKEGGSIEIKPTQTPFLDGGCSIRAKNGIVEVGDRNFSKINKINFYIPERKARKGQGFFTAQDGRIRLSYKFKIEDVLEKDNNHTVILVRGDYKIGKENKKSEKSVFVIDSKNKILEVIGKNIKIKYEEISAKGKGC